MKPARRLYTKHVFKVGQGRITVTVQFSRRDGAFEFIVRGSGIDMREIVREGKDTREFVSQWLNQKIEEGAL